MFIQNMLSVSSAGLLITILLWGGCQLPPQQNGNNSGGSGGQNAPSTRSTDPEAVIETLVDGISEISGEIAEISEMARPDQVQAWVDKLIVKAQPGEDMPQIGTLREGEIATYLHQRTAARTSFTLRGQRFYEPWILIRTDDGLLGWVHEGGVRYVQSDFVQWLSQQATRPNARSAQIPISPEADRVVIPGQKVGGIRLSTSEEDLMQLYGPQNLGRSRVNKPGEGPQPCTVVFPETKDEIRITWQDEERTKISAVYLMRAGGSWFTPQGLRMGLPLDELTKVNRAPLQFYGFGWKYSGTVKGWKSGRLSPYSKYFYVMLEPSDKAPSQTVQAFKGQQTYSSNAQGVESLGLRVSKWVVYLD